MRLSVDLSVDTARGPVERLLAACRNSCVPLSYRIVLLNGRRLRNISPRCSSHGGIMLAWKVPPLNPCEPKSREARF